jgi:DMSO/TMAO reductase YedYZ molybdopterin-dependent catalytic subunit
LPLLLATFNRVAPGQRYRVDEMSPHFWPNGKMPVREEWKRLAADHFREYRLHVGGLVENPVSLSLAELEALGVEESVTMHHCIQGWTGIAQWKGVPMKRLVDLVKPTRAAHSVVFYSFGDGLYGGGYYETQRLEDAVQPACLLALEMNQRPLPDIYGAPLRLRVENQLGYKMVKWLERIEFVESEKQVGRGEGGKNEDDEYFDLLPNI